MHTNIQWAKIARDKIQGDTNAMLASHNQLWSKYCFVANFGNHTDDFRFFFCLQNEDLASNSSADSGHSSNSCCNNSYHTMELSFEYLMAKNTLKWISITSPQAMLMSVCLQSIVDELLNQKDGHEIGNMLVSPYCLRYRSNRLDKVNYLHGVHFVGISGAAINTAPVDDICAP